MAKSKKKEPKSYSAAPAAECPITDTLVKNYMPYAMSVILSRAIPEIDGLKPAHRKLLYTMYGMGLLGGRRQKSANIVGATMKLNPHGDGPIYDTMVRLTRGHEAMANAYIDSKGNFGKHYSRDMAYAASRYTEAKLADICHELFDDIDKDTVDFVPNYDGTMTEPALLPVSFPTVLASPNQGIAVGMASSICSFNLGELCDTVIALIDDEQHDLRLTLPGPDFPGGGQLVVNRSAISEVYETGRGSLKLRARYSVKDGMILITEIPYTTTIEAVCDKIIELIKTNKLTGINDLKDISDRDGLCISIEPKRGVDPHALMRRLYKLTPLMDSFGCNFNILIGATPRVLGVREIISEWLAFRSECIRRRSYYLKQKADKKLHLLLGLKKMLLDIDKAIAIIKDTEAEAEVVPNLMVGFGITREQAEYIAAIRLRQLNREHILNRLDELESLKGEIEGYERILSDRALINEMIKDDLRRVKDKYAEPRKTELIEVDDDGDEGGGSDEAPAYPVTLFLSRGGYFKKITPASLRMNDKQSFKDGDGLLCKVESNSKQRLLFFTSGQNVYTASAGDFADTKASALGEYLPAKLALEPGERVVAFLATDDFSGQMLFFFENGKAAKVPLESYKTQTNRKKLVNAFCGKSALVKAFFIKEEQSFALFSSNNKLIIVDSALIPQKVTRSTQGVNVISLRGKNTLTDVLEADKTVLKDPGYYRVGAIPAAGHFLREGDMQMSL